MIMKNYDMHSHILHNIDDGSQDIDVSLVLLEQQWLQGVTHLALTPHFYTNHTKMDWQIVQDFLQIRKYRFNQLVNLYDGDIKLKLGCELHITPHIFNANDISDFCYQDTNYLLAEMPYDCIFSEEDIKMLQGIMHRYNVIPVLAHIERYPKALNNVEILTRLIDMGCLIQINMESLIRFSTRMKVTKLINNGYVHLLGSDMHSTVRGCDYAKGMERILRNCNKEIIQNITNTAEKIFGE